MKNEIRSLVKKEALSVPEASRVIEEYPGAEVWVCPVCGRIFLLVHLMKKKHKLFRLKGKPLSDGCQTCMTG
jgi:rubrerythrin